VPVRTVAQAESAFVCRTRRTATSRREIEKLVARVDARGAAGATPRLNTHPSHETKARKMGPACGRHPENQRLSLGGA